MLKVFSIIIDCDNSINADVIENAIGEYLDNKHDGTYLNFDVNQIFPKKR